MFTYICIKQYEKPTPIFMGKQFEKGCLPEVKEWEHVEKKISYKSNHHGLTLRSLSKNKTPVGLKLKTNIKLYRARCIMYEAERDLIQENYQ